MKKSKLRFRKQSIVLKIWFLPLIIALFCLCFVYAMTVVMTNWEVLGETPIEYQSAEVAAQSHIIGYNNIVELKTKTPLLVNKSNKLPDDFVPENLVEIVNGHMATEETTKAYTRMRTDAIASGLMFNPASAYISIDYQRTVYNKAVQEKGQDLADREIARPGHSEHQTGRALDIVGSFGQLEDFKNTPEALWIAEHANEYGFIIRYGLEMEGITGFSYEPWHITYVGIEIAQEMKQQNIKSLEEYMNQNPDIVNELYEPNGKIVVIDAGHGEIDSGCVWNGIEEKKINLDIAAKVKNILKEKGHRVIMTRSGDNYLSIIERVEMANSCNADVFVSIHQNSYESSDIRGMETWYDNTEPNRDSFNLARLIHTETILASGANDRALRQNNELYVITETKMPACIIETGYLSNYDERTLLTTEDYQKKIAQGIAEGIDLFLTPKEMHLTFDDGPSAKYTPTILDILKERGIKATFFLIGENVRKNPEIARRIVSEGHAIGIHCNRHDYKELYASVESFVTDFNKASEIIFKETGIQTKLFRFPGGSLNSFNKKTNKDIIKEMTNNGFIYFDWNACIDEALKNPDKEAVLDKVKSEIEGTDKVILLAHDTSAKTAEHLPGILDILSEYRMSILTPDTKPIQFAIN